MEEILSGTQADEMQARRAVPRLRLLDPSSATEGMLDKALAYCAEKMHLDSADTALNLLREGNSTARWYGHHSLAEQVAEVLGDLDNTVQSVFVFDLDATPEDVAFAEPTATSPIHMIVRAQRKTEALHALVRALEDALLAEYATRVGPGQLQYLLDVQVIDAKDVEKRRGYAGLLSSLYNMPIQVWQRDQEQPQTAGQTTPIAPERRRQRQKNAEV